MLLVDAAHEGGGRRQDGVDKDEDNLLGGELDALPDDVDKLAYGEVCGDKVLLLVDRGDVRLLDLLADDLRTRRASVMRLLWLLGRNAAFVQRLTGMRSVYFCRMRSASALRFSKGCSSLNLERMMAVMCLIDLLELRDTGCRV